MNLRLKIFLCCAVLVLSVGGFTAYLFAGAWKDLAKVYALASTERALVSPENAEGVEWIVEMPGAHQIKSPKVFHTRFFEKLLGEIQKTNTARGSFEQSGPDGKNYFISFMKTPSAVTAEEKFLISGVETQVVIGAFSAWAAPFLGLVLVALILAGLFAALISTSLNRVYLLMERSLENIGAGRLENLALPQSRDPAVKGMISALENMVGLLKSKDKKIAQVSNLANEDAMTGIPNYRAFEDFMNGLMSGLFVPESVPVLGILDLDHFKKVNDTYGHQVGDYVLKIVASIIEKNIRVDSASDTRSPDFFGRYGGEEFVVVFTSVRRDSVHVGPQRILHEIKNTIVKVPAEISETKTPLEFPISASMGISIWEKESFSKEEWIKEADTALYDAKRSGRGRLIELKPQRREWL
ncbi:MAG TPA: GGDEF domain-containing protein [Bdellovibrionota bacterium]|nr:GGDEF domain-containing protein [Bdellovibrionota bacterium]